MTEDVSRALFEAVAKKDYGSLARLYGTNAQSSILSFLSMKSRWNTFVGEGRSGKSYAICERTIRTFSTSVRCERKKFHN